MPDARSVFADYLARVGMSKDVDFEAFRSAHLGRHVRAHHPGQGVRVGGPERSVACWPRSGR
jgi:hypothetical protein